MQRLIYMIDQLSKTVGHAFAWCIIIVTFGTCYEVFVRYVLADPTSWAFDMSYLMYGAIFYMAGAYTLSRGGHVRADMFYRRCWEVGTLHRKSWTGLDIRYEPFHLAWKIDLDHELARACRAAYRETFGREPGGYDFWDFSTNAVTPVRLGIPTIGFGPGEYKLAHMRNESCEVDQILDACGFYARLIEKI